MKKYVLPILLGAIAGTIAYWAMDGFPSESSKYFIKNFIKTLPILIVVIVVMQMNNRKGKETKEG